MNKYLSLFLINLPGIGKKRLFSISQKVKKNNILLHDDDILSGIGLSNILLSIDNTLRYPNTEIDKAYTYMRQTLDKCRQFEIKIIGIDEDGYPSALRDIPDCPLYLFYKGDISIANSQPNIALVGTREPTAHGYDIGFRFGEVLADHNVTVVSGLALGCDTSGHSGCLRKKGKTVAVMAEGLHKIYPAANKELANEIVLSGGCLISEYPPGQRAFKSTFVERDRLQSGLSAGIIVIETDVVGGTMHTVNYALEQNRYVGAYKHSDKFASVKQAQGNIALINSHKAQPLRYLEEITHFIDLCKKPKGTLQSVFHERNQTAVYEEDLFEGAYSVGSDL